MSTKVLEVGNEFTTDEFGWTKIIKIFIADDGERCYKVVDADGCIYYCDSSVFIH